jgi:hypothetical protein
LSLAPWDLRGWLGADCYSKVPSADSELVPGRFRLAQLVRRDGCSHRLPRHECGAHSGFWNPIVSDARHVPSTKQQVPASLRLDSRRSTTLSATNILAKTRGGQSPFFSTYSTFSVQRRTGFARAFYMCDRHGPNGMPHLLFCGLCDATNPVLQPEDRENHDAQRPWLPACRASCRVQTRVNPRRPTMRSERTTSQPIDAAHPGDHETARIAPRNTSS